MRITSRHWEEPDRLSRDEVLQICNVDGRLHFAHKEHEARRVRRSTNMASKHGGPDEIVEV